MCSPDSSLPSSAAAEERHPRAHSILARASMTPPLCQGGGGTTPIEQNIPRQAEMPVVDPSGRTSCLLPSTSVTISSLAITKFSCAHGLLYSFICLFIYLFIHLFIYLFIYVFPSFFLSLFLSLCISLCISLFISLFISLLFYLFLSFFLSLFTPLFISIFIS